MMITAERLSNKTKACHLDPPIGSHNPLSIENAQILELFSIKPILYPDNHLVLQKLMTK